MECPEIEGGELHTKAGTYLTLVERDWRTKGLGMIHPASVYSLSENERGSFWNPCGIFSSFFFFSCEQRLTTHYRSPDIEPAARHDSGGWGLAAAQIETSKADEEDDEPSDWEQVHVRTFVDSTGIKSPSANLGERRRRMT